MWPHPRGVKVLDVAEFYAEKGGGVKTYIDQKLRAGAALGHEVVIVAPGPEDREEDRLGGRVIWVKSPRVPGDPRYNLFVDRGAVHAVLDRERPDVTEGSSVYGGGWFVANWPGQTVRSLVFHQDPVAALGHPLLDRFVSAAQVDWAAAPFWSYLRRLGGRYDTTVVAGQWLQSRLTAFGVPRVSAVPFGIDPEPFRNASRDDELRAELLRAAKVPEDAPLLVTVSRHHPEKRLFTLIRAVRMLSDAQPVALAIFGDGPLRKRVEAEAAKGAGVVIAGYTRDRDHLARALASADALLHGSAAETYGLVVAEAMCAGTPLVVPDAGGAADLADPQYAEVYPPGDAAKCSAAIRRLLSRDAMRLRVACLEAARSVRTLDDHFAALFAHYQAAVEAGPVSADVTGDTPSGGANGMGFERSSGVGE